MTTICNDNNKNSKTRCEKAEQRRTEQNGVIDIALVSL